MCGWSMVLEAYRKYRLLYYTLRIKWECSNLWLWNTDKFMANEMKVVNCHMWRSHSSRFHIWYSFCHLFSTVVSRCFLYYLNELTCKPLLFFLFFFVKTEKKSRFETVLLFTLWFPRTNGKYLSKLKARIVGGLRSFYKFFFVFGCCASRDHQRFRSYSILPDWYLLHVRIHRTHSILFHAR